MICNSKKRKIQKVIDTHLVSTPVDCTKRMKLVKGDTIKIEIQEDDSLKITRISEARQDSPETGSATSSTEEEMLAWKI